MVQREDGRRTGEAEDERSHSSTRADADCVCVQELECLQDHLDDLVSMCRDVVGNLTELESEVSRRVFMCFTVVSLSLSHLHGVLSPGVGHPDRRSAHQSL